MKAIIARKVGMTQIYDNDSKSIAVTVLDASSCRAVQIKSIENDGYDAAQLTIGESKRPSDPLASHYKKYDVEPGLGLWEVSLDEDSQITPGKQIIVSSILEPESEKRFFRASRYSLSFSSLSISVLEKKSSFLFHQNTINNGNKRKIPANR